MKEDEILAIFLQDILHDSCKILARECINLAEILQDLIRVALLLQVSFKI